VRGPSGGHYDEPVTSVVGPVQPRALADRCPGLLRPHRAEDGLLVRLRVPGGQTTSAVLRELGRISDDLGAGGIQLTSRGNLQLRGLDAARTAELVQRVAEVGLLPSVTHERVRNLVASPATGLLPGRADLRAMVRELDLAICSTPELAELPGRFLFALDDGSGDVSSLRFDLGYRADGPAVAAGGTVLVGGAGQGFRVAATEAVPELIALAVAFLRARKAVEPAPWHVAELADLSEVDGRLRPVRAFGADGGPLPLGRLGDAASVSVPLSVLDRGQLAAVDRAAAGGPVVVTPWRGLVIPGAAAALRELAAAGLVVDDGSPWSQLTACVGAPGCARSAISTRAVAAALAAELTAPPRLPVHLSGCARRCGAPASPYVDLVAPASLPVALAAIGSAR
jgi:precorrin-3B synthase